MIRCASCFGPADPPHTDKYHRGDRALCGECYVDPQRARDTATDPDDPTSWWNRKERS